MRPQVRLLPGALRRGSPIRQRQRFERPPSAGSSPAHGNDEFNPNNQKGGRVDTLVLNATYEPVAHVPWQRAILWLFTNKVEVIEEYEDRKIRSVTFEIKMPSVVRFFRMLRGHLDLEGHRPNLPVLVLLDHL